MSWVDYIHTPEELYPGKPVLSATYTLKETSYDATVHVILEPNYYFSEFTTRIFEPYYYLYKSDLSAHPVFESEEFGYTYQETNQDYKAGTGSVAETSITWTSSIYLIVTQEQNFFYGPLHMTC